MKTASKIKKVVKKKLSEKEINELLTKKMAKLQSEGKGQMRPSKAVLTHAKKQSKSKIVMVIEWGMNTMKTEKAMTDIIVSDLFNRKNGDSELTIELNRIFKEDRSEKVAQVKKWVKSRLQTLIKESTVQDRLLGEKVKTEQITVKKVTKPMVENVDGLYLDNFNESDLGTFKSVRIKKVKNEDTLEESLMKWMRSQGLHDKEADEYDTETVKALIENIEKGIV